LPKYTTHSTPPALDVTSALSLSNTSTSQLNFVKPFRTRWHLSPNSACLNFASSVLTRIPKQPVPSPPPSFTPNFITVIVFITSVYNLHQSAPIYFSQLCIPVAATAKRSHLRSAEQGNLVISNV